MMRKRMNHKVLLEAVRFGLVGVLATSLHYGIYYVLLSWVWTNLAYATGYVLSFFCNFYLSAYFTFHSVPSWRKLVGMAGAHGVNFLLHMVLLNFFLWLGISPAWAPLPVFCVAIPVNFVLVRWVFKSKKMNVI